MAVKLLFNPSSTGGIEPIVKTPTLVIAKKSGEKLGAIPSTNIRFECNLNSANTIDFKVYKTRNGVDFERWDEVKDFRLLWVKEWDMWFEMHIDITQSTELVKAVNCISIGESELSVIKLFNIEINTEDDINREDYVQTVLFDDLNHNGSLLHRILEKAPHYTIEHVDESIANIQRTFTFDGVSIQEAFNTISEEIGCIFVLSQKSNIDGVPERGIYVYDMMSHCNACGHRDEHFTECPECGSTNVEDGFGKDTGIFISDENIAKEITFTSDTDNVFNCFKLEAGDDDITSAVANLNPNGSDYIWNFPEHTISDMSDELSHKISDYNTQYNYYQKEYEFVQIKPFLDSYNALVEKYAPYNENIEKIESLIGFNASTNVLYGAIDFELFLTSGLVPSIEMSDTDASEQVALLTTSSLSPVAVTNLDYASHSTVKMNVLSVAKSIIRPTYKVEIVDSEYDTTTHVWTGSFKVTNYSYDDDTATSDAISITVTDDYKTFIKQKINNVLNREDSADYSVTELFKKTLIVDGDTFSGEFADEIKKYCRNMLGNFHDSCQSCLDVLVEEGISDSSVWTGQDEDLYNQFYEKYYQKLQALEKEISVRDSEIDIIRKTYESVIDERSSIHNILNLKNYIGIDLWKEFCSFRRESTYSNSNYISDGLNNSEVLQLAEDFLKTAKAELVKSSTLQHSISSSLNNLLLYDSEQFKKLAESFEVGNWLRIKIDGKIYQLRLIRYAIDFDNLGELDVEFSDVMGCNDSISDIQSILKQASSMASTYQTVERQADKNSQTTKVVDTWFEDGLDATLTKLINDADSQTMVFDGHGLLMRSYDEMSGNYSPEQLKIINSTLAVTDDNWVTTKTAIGKFLYYDPVTGELKKAYGVNAETVIGKLILGQSLGIYNGENTLKFDADGLNVTNGMNTFIVNPQSQSVISLLNGNTPVLSVDDDGNLAITGKVTATSGLIGGMNISSDDNSGTTEDGGHVAGNSLFIQSNDGVHEYEAGIKGSATSGVSTFYVKRIPVGGEWEDSEYTYYVTNKGYLYCTDANINGTINALSGRIGGMNISSDENSGVTADGGHVAGNSLFVQSSDENYEYEAGIKGSSINGLSTFYVKRITIGDEWENSEYTYYVTNKGYLYCNDANIEGAINAHSGKIGGFNITSTINNGTTANGGHCFMNSLYVHTSSSGKEYEAGLKGENEAGTISFYVKQMASGGNWSDARYVYYVNNLGKLYAENAEIKGALTATSLSTGSKTSSGTGSAGTYIDSNGDLFAGASNQIIIRGSNGTLNIGNGALSYNGSALSVTGNITARSFTVSGTTFSATTTITDEIVITLPSYTLISGGQKFFTIKSGSTTVASYGSDEINYAGGKISYSDSVFTCNKTFHASNLRLNQNGALYATTGSNYHSVVLHYGSSIYFGVTEGSSASISTTYLRGKVVRLYAYSGGGVYLGTSGSTAVTSDETFKDLYNIDDRYVDFFDKLNPVVYKYKVGHRRHLGFGAQSVEKALLDSGLETEDFAGIVVEEDVDIDDSYLSLGGSNHFNKLYSLRYEEFIALNTMMIKKLQERIKDLERQLVEIKR